MPGLGSLCGVWDIKHVRSRPREKEARELLEKIADQVKPICVAHKWNVQMLEEFVPPNAGLLGMNVNRKKIFIRLRPASDVGSFYPYEALLHTMLHELVHMEIGPHSAKFYKMLDELRDECEKLMREGISGRNMPFAGNGTQLGGGRTAVDARAAALKAAEKRQRQQGVMGGGHRLGGGSVGASGSAAERAAAAAEWRVAVTRGCAATHHGASSQADGGCGGHGGGGGDDGGDGDGWDCDLCTLHNSSEMAACDVCGTPRGAIGRPHDAPGGRSGNASTSGGGSGGGGGTRAENSVSGGKKSAGIGGARQGLSATAAGKAPCRAYRGSTSTAAAATAGGRSSTSTSSSSNVGRPALSTWTCRECPFAFPNAAERSTCETCGARRAGEGVGVGAIPVTGGAGVAQRQGLPPPPSWECGRCTVVNPKNFLDCGACRAPRAFGLGSGAVGGSFAGLDEVGRQDGAWMSGGGGGGIGEGAVGDSPGRGRVCGVCTLRNPADAFACAACGIPLAESEAVTGAAAAVAAEAVAGASTAAAAVATSTSGGGTGRLPRRRRRDREDDVDDDDHDSRRSVKPNAPELIDLS